MKLIGSLEDFQPATLLQWFQTERADGILAVEGSPGYRLRFQQGELVAASHWPPGESLERRLRRAVGETRAEAMRVAAERRDVTLADLVAEVLGAEDASSLVRSHAEGVIFRMLDETRGRFFFDPAARDLPAALETHLHVSQILLERARRQDEENRLADWIPAATIPLKLVQKPDDLDESESGLRGALVDGLRVLRSRQQLEAMIPEASHTVRLKLAELVRSGNIEVMRQPVSEQRSVAPAAESAAPGVLNLTKRPTADDWPFLTASEARLMNELDSGPQSLEDASRSLRRDTRELTPAADLLAETEWIAIRKPPTATRWMRSLVFGAALGGALAVFLLLFPSLSSRFGGPASQEAGAEEALSQPRPEPHAEATMPEAENGASRPADVVGTAEADGSRTSRTGAEQRPVKARDGVAEREAELEKRFDAELAAARKAFEGDDLSQAEDALARAAALRPGAARLSELWREIQLAAAPTAPTQSLPSTGPLPVERSPVDSAPAESVAVESLPVEPAPVEPAPVEPAPAPGRLVINAVPYGFVRLDGEEKGATPLRLELAPGDYTLEIFRAGYVPIVRRIELESATVFLETFNLEEEGEGGGDRP